MKGKASKVRDIALALTFRDDGKESFKRLWHLPSGRMFVTDGRMLIETTHAYDKNRYEDDRKRGLKLDFDHKKAFPNHDTLVLRKKVDTKRMASIADKVLEASNYDDGHSLVRFNFGDKFVHLNAQYVKILSEAMEAVGIDELATSEESLTPVVAYDDFTDIVLMPIRIAYDGRGEWSEYDFVIDEETGELVHKSIYS